MELEDGHGAVGRRPSTWAPVTFDPASIPLDAPSAFDLEVTYHGTEYRGDAAGMGNPHLVLFVDDVATARVTQHGPHLEHDERFPNAPTSSSRHGRAPDRARHAGLGTRRGRDAVVRHRRVRVAAVAHRRGLVGERVTVHVPGGDLTVELGDTVRLGGPVVHVFDVEVDLEPSRGTAGRRRLTATEVDLEVVRQRALLVGTGFGTRSAEAAEASLDELALLADTAGAEPVERVLQRRDRPDPATYIGSGKARSCTSSPRRSTSTSSCSTTSSRRRSNATSRSCSSVDVVDRVALILDIFAQHATSQEGMVQVELAQLRYRLPRCVVVAAS